MFKLKSTMHLSLWITLLVTLFCSSVAWAGAKGFHPNGKLKWEYLYQNGAISEAKWYDEQGIQTSRALYTDGQPVATAGYRADGTMEWQIRQLEGGHQEVTRFDAGGQPVVRYAAVDGQPDGEYTTFHPNGEAKQTVTYQMGILEGPARTFFSTGQLEHEFAYRAGEVDGLYRSYSAEGTLLSEYTFKAGKLH